MNAAVNKDKKIAKKRGFFGQLWDFTCFTLVLIGIVGLCWNALGDNGWVEHVLGVVWDLELRYPIVATPIIGGIIMTATLFLRGEMNTGNVSQLHDWLVYITMTAGAFYAIRFILANL
jgi:hypothetical protein